MGKEGKILHLILFYASITEKVIQLLLLVQMYIFISE